MSRTFRWHVNALRRFSLMVRRSLNWTFIPLRRYRHQITYCFINNITPKIKSCVVSLLNLLQGNNKHKTLSNPKILFFGNFWITSLLTTTLMVISSNEGDDVVILSYAKCSENTVKLLQNKFVRGKISTRSQEGQKDIVLHLSRYQS